jgi:hypothetical protein
VQLFEWWSIPRRGWIIILAELCVIIGFSGWVVSEYFNNVYFQSYVNSIMPVLVPVVSLAFGIASASAATALYFGIRNLRRLDEVSTSDEETRNRARMKHPPRRHVPSDLNVSAPVNGPNSNPKPLIPPKSIISREAPQAAPAEKKESQ